MKAQSFNSTQPLKFAYVAKFLATFSLLILLSITSTFSLAETLLVDESETEADVIHSDSIIRAVLTSNIDEREPTDNLNAKAVDPDLTKIFFFTEVSGLANQSITHRWYLNGKLQAEVPLNIGANRWRTYSSKNLIPMLKGTWTVEAINQQNQLLASSTFTY